jgi:hypothetical protein
LRHVHSNEGHKDICSRAFHCCELLKNVRIPLTVNTMKYPSDEEYLEFIGIKGPNTLPLAIRLSALYPDATATITIDQFLYLYSLDRIEYCYL